MKYILFGGKGFLGTHLVESFKKKHMDFLCCDLRVDKESATEKYVDIRDGNSLKKIPLSADDVIINLAATQYHEKVPQNARDYFFETNADGVRNILEWASNADCGQVVLYTTDMVYGKPQYLPVDENHSRNPFGYYGQSKKMAEDLALDFRKQGMRITIFRPRMILGPGRMGILRKLFKLLRLGLPIPMIGNGSNHYQMVSVFDCVDAILLALEKGVPNDCYNLGSQNPPTVRMLLQDLARKNNSKSFLIPTNGRAIKTVLAGFEKIGLPLMYKEQYMIADEEYVLDIGHASDSLGWQPKYDDGLMLAQAYEEFKRIF